MNRHARRAAARLEFRAGVQAMAAEADGVVKITTIRPEDFVGMMADAVAGHGNHADLLETVSDLVARVTRARSTPSPMLCAACPAELTGGYAVVIATGARALPSRGLGMGVCTACGCDVPSIEAAALKGLQAIWPDLRPITIHPHEGARMSDSMGEAPTPLTLAGLATAPYWVAWQLEDRPKGGPSKIPYSPKGGKARADAPSTWGSRPAAEKIAALLPKPYGLGGVGIELAKMGDGRSLGGIDLDTCRDIETGALQGWAEDVMAVFDSYVEVSPSNTGAKLFFTYDSDALPTFRAAMGTAEYGKQFKRPGDDHPPAIELHLGNRYFAVTDALLDGSRLDLRHIETDRILRLIQVDGPAFVGVSAPRPASATRKRGGGSTDRSRSSVAFGIGKRAVRNGATFEEMCQALRDDTDSAEWMAEKGEANDLREARRIFEKAKACGPIIQVLAGAWHTNADEAESAILAAGLPVFQRGANLVRPFQRDVSATKGRTTTAAGLAELNTHVMIDTLCGVAEWERFDARSAEWLRTNPPKQVADIILSRHGRWRVPTVAGVITTPTMRADGSLLAAQGYDQATRLYHVADSSLVLHPAVQKPTREHAVGALKALRELLAGFPFVVMENEQRVSEAVALSALITPVIRGAIPVAPMHAFRANTAGSGKSYLADTSSAIATGRPCPVISAAPGDEAETEKRIAGLLIAGFPIISLDNINGELGGDLLCQAIERPLVQLRPLGRSDIVEIESRSTIFGTGNNLRVRGDMVRRTLVSDLDAGVERPEERQFAFDPVATILADRGRYVSACLVIVRAYLLAGSPDKLPPIASFEAWSDLVRSALVWLGEADPALSMKAARDDDPELGDLREVMDAWRQAFGADPTTCRGAIDAASEKVAKANADGDVSAYAQQTEPRFPGLQDALIRVAGFRGNVDPVRLGRWLLAREGRIVGSERFKRDAGNSHGVARWKLARVG